MCDAAAHDWVRRPGCYAILVGASSRDLPLKGTVPIAGARCGPTARRGCASRRSVLIHVRGVRHVRVRSLAVYVNGRRREVRRAGRTAVRVSLSGRPKRLAHVRVVATTRRGRRIVDRRTYRPCTRR